MIIVCNTGPLIALAKLDSLTLLKELGFQRVLIPVCVRKELLGKIGPESNTIEVALDEFIEVEKLGATEQPVEAAASTLDEGEKEVILLGASIKDRVILLLDDQAGRRVARTLGIPVVGTAGLLLSAKKQGLIKAVSPLLISLREQGYWLSDALIAEVRRLSGECGYAALHGVIEDDQSNKYIGVQGNHGLSSPLFASPRSTGLQSSSSEIGGPSYFNIPRKSARLCFAFLTDGCKKNAAPGGH